MPRRPSIDGYEFASSGATMSGAWPTADFPRLRQLLLADAGALEYSLEGVTDELGRPALRIRIRGTLQLRCQRCLAPLDYPLRVDAMLVLARSQEAIDALPVEAEGPDWVVAGKEMSVHDLLEDELLLAVPYAPRHERCAASSARGAAEALSPFAGLRSLLGTNRSETQGKRS